VVMGLPFGHGRQNWTLPLGTRARLDATAGTLEILEAATTTMERTT
jgi:muramoyltetrapeptide carboxypeptidase